MKTLSRLMWPGFAAAVMLISGVISGCSEQATPGAVIPIVVTTRVTSGASGGASADVNTYAGEVRARFETPLSFQIPGRLISRSVHLGDEVKKGAVLAELDPVDSTASLHAVEAQLRSAENRLTLAQQTKARMDVEAKEDLVSRSDLEQSDTSLATAKAEVDQLRAQRDIAQNQSKYTRLTADNDGLITSENAEEGAVLAAGQPVFGFAVAGERDVVIDVSEDRVATMKTDQSARVALPSTPGITYTAKVRDVAKAADPQSRTFHIKLSLDNPDTVRPGITATVTFAAATSDQTITIPASALFHKGSDTAVWVVEPKTHVLQLRSVGVASYTPDQVVLARGLNDGEEIVTKGVNTVNAGMVVHPAPDTGKGGQV